MSLNRKRLKNKKSCCALCKPHKRGIENRWKPKHIRDYKLAKKEILQFIR